MKIFIEDKKRNIYDVIFRSILLIYYIIIVFNPATGDSSHNIWKSNHNPLRQSPQKFAEAISFLHCITCNH